MAPEATAAIIAGTVVIVLIAGTVYARRNGYSGIGGDTIVRCRSGHLFTTIWVPGASFKAVRLGVARFQFCPVGRHWTIVMPVKDDELSTEDRQQASQFHDARIP